MPHMPAGGSLVVPENHWFIEMVPLYLTQFGLMRK